MNFFFKDYQTSVSFQKVEKMRNIFLLNHKWNNFPNIGSEQALNEEIAIFYGSKLSFFNIQDFIVNIYAMVYINTTVDSAFRFKLPPSLIDSEFILEKVSKETLLDEIVSRISPFFSFGLDQMDNPFTLHLELGGLINGYRLMSSFNSNRAFLFEDEASYYYFSLS